MSHKCEASFVSLLAFPGSVLAIAWARLSRTCAMFIASKSLITSISTNTNADLCCETFAIDVSGGGNGRKLAIITPWSHNIG